MINKIYPTTLMIPLLAAGLFAQAPTKQGLLMALAANGKQMAPYQWKQKVTVVRNGSPLEPTIEELRFDASGQLQRTTLSKPEEQRMGPIRARKVAEVKESVMEVMQLARQYASPQQLSQSIQKGEVWEGQGSLRIQARAMILPMDEMTVVFSGSTYLPKRMDCKTQHDHSPVTISVDYEKLPNGPSMMTRMTVQIPKENIVVNVDSYDFVRLAVPNVSGF